MKWGFDEFLIWGAGQPDEDEAGGKRKKGADGAKIKPDRYWSPDYNLNGGALPNSEGKYGPDVLNDFVIDFVRRHKDGPFFVYYPTPLIHGPILKTPDSQGDVAKQRRKAANAGEGSLYVDNITYLDKLIGKLVAELDRLKLRESTLIVFAGDNGSVPIGTVHGRPVDGKKHDLTEGGSRVPLIANWPGVTPAGVRSDLVDFSDLLPTFAGLAGAKLQAEPKIDGHSFAPQLRGEMGHPREWAYVQLGGDYYVRSQRWKLTGDGQFFDMSDAPFRQIPVSIDTNDNEAKAARDKLQTALKELAPSDVPPAKRKKKAK